VIYGNSTDPVLIKKINLKVWLLRDEIEAVAQGKLESDPNAQKSSLVESLKGEYSPKNNISADNILYSDGAISNDDGEDLMAAAIAGDDDGEDLMASAIDGADDGEDLMASAIAGDDDGEDLMASAINTPDTNNKSSEDNIIYINQRYPVLDDSKVYLGRTLLGEIDIDKIPFFSSQKFAVGQSIVVDFIIPKRFRLNAEVLYCRQYSMKSRIISKNSLPYRLVAKFTFQNQGEKTLLRNFLQSIEVDIPIVEKPSQQKSKADDDDDFGELDDLGL